MSSFIPIEEKKKLIKTLKEAKLLPLTGHGDVKINFIKGDITMVEVTTKNLPQKEEETKYIKKI